MNPPSVQQQFEEFSQEWQHIVMLYNDYARSVGINYTALQVLRYIAELETCTQKNICAQSFLPRQTVNTIITGFCKKGYVELRESAEDHRVKTIHFTKAGKLYADSISQKLQQAEYQTMAQLSDAQRTALLAGFHAYARSLQSQLSK